MKHFETLIIYTKTQIVRREAFGNADYIYGIKGQGELQKNVGLTTPHALRDKELKNKGG